MKIAVNATILDDKPTGLGIYTIDIVREISKHIKPDDKLIVFTSHPEVFKGYNLKIERVSKWVQPKYGKRAAVLRFFWSQIVFPLRLLRNNVDLVYNTIHQGVFFTYRLQIITIHDLLCIKFPKQYKFQYCYFKFILPHLLKKCVAIIANSKNTKADISNYYNILPEKIHVVYCSYNEENFKPISPGRITPEYGLNNYLLIVGASFSHKNIDRVLEAYSRVEHKINHDLVIIGGRKNYIDFLKKRAKALGIDKDTIFLGYVSLSNLSTLYSKASALIFPSLYEGFGIPPLEAMACGCPVVVSNTSSLPEVCGNAAYYINPYSVDRIADSIYKLVADEELRKSLIEKGLERVKMFSWEKTAKETLKIFEGVIVL